MEALTDPTTGHADHGPLGIDELDLELRVREILRRWPAVGLAVGVVRNGRLESFAGRGLADIASNTPITEDTVFRIGSVTKTFTAIAVLQLWEQGLVDLDAPANDYLRAYRLVPAKAGFRPATVRQLLTHTAGIRKVLHPSGLFRMRDLGETVRVGRPVPALAEYYRGGLRIDAEPGTRFAYTNHGFATLGPLRPSLQWAFPGRSRLVHDLGEPDGGRRRAAPAAGIRAVGRARPFVRRPGGPRVRAAPSRQPVAPGPAGHRGRQPLGAGACASAARQARLGEIKVPTLVLAGRDDFLFPPEHQRELAAGIPNARLQIVERAGHNAHSERPAEVIEAVSDFIAADAAV
jgi:pimeloyl-ACP methyl ester carboxylesterase